MTLFVFVYPLVCLCLSFEGIKTEVKLGRYFFTPPFPSHHYFHTQPIMSSPAYTSFPFSFKEDAIAAAQKIYFFLLLNIPKEYIYMLATPLYICWFVHFQLYNCVIVAHLYSPSSRNHGSRWPIVSGLWLEWAHCFGSWVRTDPLFRTGGWMGPTWILRKPKEDMLMAYISNWQGGF